jgi:uncharacterized protein
MSKKIIVVGASDNPERYSYKAIKMLQAKGYTPIPVHPKLTEIESLKVYPSLESLPKEEFDTITLYINPEISSSLAEEIIKINPHRVIFNPGSENAELEKVLSVNEIETLEACTLVMLSTEQF